MKILSISGFACYVQDLAKTSEFYERLGFRPGKQEAGRMTCYVNWFSVDFVEVSAEDKSEFAKEANLENKGAGLFINISVDTVDEFYEGIIAKGFTPSSEPRDWPWGRREFVLRDPDGYKLVFFQKIK
ncbi:MAG TPA: VOC family protein [Candidatus Microsaccharimonas sp.]|nr:VOC family protein [Candidatus Microsaccharimonas sp.]